MQKTRMALVIDRSGSMTRIWRHAEKAMLGILGSISDGANERQQQVEVTVIAFDSRVDTVVHRADPRDIAGPLPIRPPNGGQTALLDAIAKAADTMKGWGDDPDVAYVVLAFTDGEENSSTRFLNRNLFQSYIAGLVATGRWTFTLQVPNGYRGVAARDTGFERGNIREWDATAAGIAELEEKTSGAISTYLDARARGFTQVADFYPTVVVNSNNLGDLTVKGALRDLSDRLDTLTVYPDSNPVTGKVWKIREFVESIFNRPYIIGSSYYQLTKTEEVQPEKLVLVRDSFTGRIYGGAEARRLIGLPTDGRKAKVVPGSLGKWQVFFQSTSVNRNLVPGTTLIFDSRQQPGMRPTWDHVKAGI